jgi:hypothetical protein
LIVDRAQKYTPLDHIQRTVCQLGCYCFVALSEKQLPKKTVQSRALQFDQIGRFFESCFRAQASVAFVGRALTPSELQN